MEIWNRGFRHHLCRRRRYGNKFESKKDIVLQGANQAGWRANVTPEIFENVEWDLEADLKMFMGAYIDRMTPDFVNLSIGLRAPQLYEETKELIMKVPQAFLRTFTDYLNKMCAMGKIPEKDYETLALTVFSATFGYTFLNASFGTELTEIEKDRYIKESVQMFVKVLSVLWVFTYFLICYKPPNWLS